MPHVPLRRKTPVFGFTTAASEKPDKRLANRVANRAFCKAVKHALKAEREIMPAIREVSNVWSFEKDGKHYVKAQDWGAEMLGRAMRK